MRNLLCLLLSLAMQPSSYVWSEELPAATHVAAKKSKKCLFPKSKKKAPAWICNAHTDGMDVAAVGFAAKSKAGMEHMEQMAVADARAHLAQSLSESSQSKNELESDRVTKITNALLTDTKIIKRAYGPKGTLYVLIGIDEAGAQKLREAAGADDGRQNKGE